MFNWYKLTPAESLVNVKLVFAKDTSLSCVFMNGEISAPLVTWASRRLLSATGSFKSFCKIGAGIFWNAASVGMKAVKGPVMKQLFSIWNEYVHLNSAIPVYIYKYIFSGQNKMIDPNLDDCFTHQNSEIVHGRNLRSSVMNMK